MNKTFDTFSDILEQVFHIYVLISFLTQLYLISLGYEISEYYYDVIFWPNFWFID